jgi:tetratricopeptide (TPR) repeat protein
MTSFRYIKYFLGLSVSLLAIGCATSTSTIAPDGSPAVAIKCGAVAQDQCLLKAGEACPGGYDVINSNDAQYLGQVGSSSVSGSWNRYGGGVYGSGLSVPVVTPNTMLIRCKPTPIALMPAKVNTQLGEKAAAEKVPQSSVVTNSIAAEWSQKSLAAADSGNWTEAIRTALVAIKNDPEFANGHINLCRGYIGYGDFAEAEISCQKALAIDPKSLTALNNISIVKEKQGNTKEALDGYKLACMNNFLVACSNFERIKGYSPKDLRGAANRISDLASIAISKKDWAETIRLSNEAIEIYPDAENAYINRASAYVYTGQNELAIADANKAIDLNPNHGMAYNNRGAALLAKGELKKAKLDFDIACGLKVELACTNSRLMK